MVSGDLSLALTLPSVPWVALAKELAVLCKVTELDGTWSPRPVDAAAHAFITSDCKRLVNHSQYWNGNSEDFCLKFLSLYRSIS